MRNFSWMAILYFLLIHAVSIAQSPKNATKAPDYSQLKYWAAHPLKEDEADRVPVGLSKERRDSSVDVFFLHPTTFTGDFANAAFSADVNDEKLNNQTDNRAILNQATIFNASGKVYAPRYRQGHLKSFYLATNPQARNALDLAYEDIKAAFDYYLKHFNHGRPIIIAGHSQGAFHGIRLLKEYFDGTPLQKQLVCAYLVGWQIKKDEFKNIPFGNKPTDVGCVVGWRSHKNGSIDAITERENGNALCVNPVTWTTDNNWSNKKLYKGILAKNFEVIAAKSLSVKVEEKTNVLWVDLPESLNAGIGMSNNLHVADFNLFFANVRENVRQRVAAYFSGK